MLWIGYFSARPKHPDKDELKDVGWIGYFSARLCRDALDELKNSLSSQHPSSLCIQCSLSACLFLSNHIDEAEELFNGLRHLADRVAFEPVKGFFEVLVLVRLT